MDSNTEIPTKYVSAFIMGMKAVKLGYETPEDDPLFLMTILRNNAFECDGDAAKLQWTNGYKLASTTVHRIDGDEDLGIGFEVGVDA